MFSIELALTWTCIACIFLYLLLTVVFPLLPHSFLIPDECCFNSLSLLTHVNVCKSRPHKKPLSPNRLSHSILELCILKSSELTEQDLGVTVTITPVSVDAIKQCRGAGMIMVA